MATIETSPWHPGERAVQQRMGLTDLADRNGAIIGDRLPDPARRFIGRQPWMLVSTVLDDGTVWPSVLRGEPGFLAADDPGRISILARPVAGDPLAEALTDGRPVGTILLEPRHRRRMRANGRLAVTGDDLALRTTQVLGNCTQYIQKRTLDPEWHPEPGRLVSDTSAVSDEQRAWIESADTMFLASADTTGEADMSHRGGRPGFVRIVDGRLAFLEQPGNAMYLTLGNLERNGAAGLLFVDFDTGATLHVAGACEVLYPADDQPCVVLTPTRVVELAGAAPAPWSPPELAPEL